MKKKKSHSSKVLKRLIEYVILSLTELTSIPNVSAFAEGEIIAFVECLEIACEWSKYSKYGIEDVEQRFLNEK